MSSNYIRKTACVACNSSDAFAIYDDGHGYCFSCHHYEKNVELTDVPKQPQSTQPTKLETPALRGDFIDLPASALKKLYASLATASTLKVSTTRPTTTKKAK